MIISRSPLRVSLGGGGTDLPSYYMENGGFLIAGAINKYVYVLVNRPFNPGISLKYSSIEKIDIIDEISHPIIREVLKTLNLNSPQIEITSIADIPSGTGLGSSGSFTTGLIKALYAHYKRGIQAEELAELACDIEMNRLKVPTGKQDQYISSFGGITEFQIQNDGTVFSRLVPISISTLHDLEDNLLLFFTGISRSAGEILQDQNDKTILKNKSTINNLHKIKELGIAYKKCISQWKHK
jgi:D-glycero-alpha-D-manno-heptose-7-phosphate kinase